MFRLALLVFVLAAVEPVAARDLLLPAERPAIPTGRDGGPVTQADSIDLMIRDCEARMPSTSTIMGYAWNEDPFVRLGNQPNDRRLRRLLTELLEGCVLIGAYQPISRRTTTLFVRPGSFADQTLGIAVDDPVKNFYVYQVGDIDYTTVGPMVSVLGTVAARHPAGIVVEIQPQEDFLSGLNKREVRLPGWETLSSRSTPSREPTAPGPLDEWAFGPEFGVPPSFTNDRRDQFLRAVFVGDFASADDHAFTRTRPIHDEAAILYVHQMRDRGSAVARGSDYCRLEGAVDVVISGAEIRRRQTISGLPMGTLRLDFELRAHVPTQHAEFARRYMASQRHPDPALERRLREALGNNDCGDLAVIHMVENLARFARRMPPQALAETAASMRLPAAVPAELPEDWRPFARQCQEYYGRPAHVRINGYSRTDIARICVCEEAWTRRFALDNDHLDVYHSHVDDFERAGGRHQRRSSADPSYQRAWSEARPGCWDMDRGVRSAREQEMLRW